MTKPLTTLLAKLACWRLGHSLHINDAGRRDDDGYLRWPCQRCGQVQRVPFGLAARGQITNERLRRQRC